MVGKIKLLSISFILIVAGACTGKPVFSVEEYKTPIPSNTPFQTPTDAPIARPGPRALPSVTFSPVPSPAILPTFPQPTAALPVDFTPILYGKKYDGNTFFLLLGGVQAGKWIGPDLAAASIRGTSKYDVFTFANENFTVLVHEPETSPIHPGQYFMGTEVSNDQFGMVGVARGWPVWQGRVEELPAENEIYKQVVLDWLNDAGVSDPQPSDLRIFRIDLENDGVDEIILSATHLDDSQHYTKAGDYSILLRKVTENGAVTLPVVTDIYRSEEPEVSYPRTYLPANFIDLNQDGILEIVVDFHQWEEDGALIYAISGQEIRQVP